MTLILLSRTSGFTNGSGVRSFICRGWNCRVLAYTMHSLPWTALQCCRHSEPALCHVPRPARLHPGTAAPNPLHRTGLHQHMPRSSRSRCRTCVEAVAAPPPHVAPPRPGCRNLHSGPDSSNSFGGNGLPSLRLPRPRLTRRPPLPRPSPVRMRVQTVPFTLHTSASQPRVRRCSPSPSSQGMTPPCNTSATRSDARLRLTNRLAPTFLAWCPDSPCRTFLPSPAH